MHPSPRVAHRTHETQLRRGPFARRRSPVLCSQMHRSCPYRNVAGEVAICCVEYCAIADIHGAALTDVNGEPSDRTPSQRARDEPYGDRTPTQPLDCTLVVYIRQVRKYEENEEAGTRSKRKTTNVGSLSRNVATQANWRNASCIVTTNQTPTGHRYTSHSHPRTISNISASPSA